MANRQFAYGSDEVTIDGETYECPASACGHSPQDGELNAFAYDYDDAVRKLGYGGPNGVVPEEHAQEAWEVAISNYEQRWGGPFERPPEVEEKLAKARSVKEELGW